MSWFNTPNKKGPRRPPKVNPRSSLKVQPPVESTKKEIILREGCKEPNPLPEQSCKFGKNLEPSLMGALP